MENKGSRLALVLTTLVLLLVLALGPVTFGVAARVAEPQVDTIEVLDGLHGLLAYPYDGGGSDGG